MAPLWEVYRDRVRHTPASLDALLAREDTGPVFSAAAFPFGNLSMRGLSVSQI